MYNNNSNQMYNSNLRANSSQVDSLLKGLGAEPLFSNINDQPLSIPTPLNGSNNLSLVTYNSNTAAQQDQNAFQEAFVSLLQRLNEQNTLNYNQEPQRNQFSNQNLNQGSNQNSNQNNSNQVGLPNPISILNEMHQRHKRSSAPPKYTFMIDPNSGQFYCQLEAFGKVFKTDRPSVRKQQAKEEVALLALRTLVNGNNNSSDNNNNNNNNNNNINNKRFDGSDIMKLYDPSFNYLDSRTDSCKSEIWYRKQLNDFPGKQPRVILLEFCQMHRLPNPIYQPNNDYVGNTYFECMIGDKYFKSDKAFPKSNEAKDYIANVAFEAIYREFCENERDQFRRRNDMNQDSSRSSILNFLENHTSSHISNHIQSQSNLTSNHTSNSISSPISRSISTNQNVTSSLSPRLNTTSTSLTLPSNSNVNNNSHLNELTTALVLPNFNHDIPNIKVEEASPLNPIIKSEEGNIGNVNYSTRDQQQSSSSSISFHPYRSPGRERFPSPGFNSNNNNNNNNNNQFTKKNAGFCKKFTSLLYEMAQSKRWTPPEFNYENGVNGFVCVCNVQDYLFRGKAFSRKMDAKESAAEEAYRFLTRNFRV